MIEGKVAAGFEPVADALSTQLRRAGSGGAAVCVTHRGEVVVDAWGGARDVSGTPWTGDTVALSFSTTKGVVATLIHRLADQGRVDYDAPLVELWPEFGQAGKQRLTLRHVLAHRAGLQGVRRLVDDASQMLDWGHMTRALAAAAPRIDARGRSAYHALTYGWLVGEVVRRTTGMTVGEALQRELVQPLGLDGAWLGCPPEQRHRLAELQLPGPPSQGVRALPRKGVLLGLRAAWALLGLDAKASADALMPRGMNRVLRSPLLLDAELPAMNGVFTARALARLYTMLAGGGAIDGMRYLSQQTVKTASTVQGRGLDAVLGIPMAWRLGYHLVGTTAGVLPGAFGHFGYGGSGAFADPRRGLAVAMTVNRVAGTPLGDGRMIKIAALAVRAADRFARK
jgi:CubicO group peptidase (beta-lactamase class C family)